MKHSVLLDFSSADFSDAQICNENSLIHQSRMKAFQTIANRQLDMAEKEFGRWYPDKMKPSKVHNAISIFANRGAGKTTFLLSAINWLEKEHSKNVLCLKPIDPSMIGEKENAFVNIIAEIQRHVVDELENNNKDDNINGEELRDMQRQIDKCFVKLMEGLSFMEGIGKNGKYEEWDDVEYAAHKGIEKASSSNNIDYFFQKYIYYTLKLLGKKCIVISFDDIDTDFNKGYEILEIIRRFLTTPMIITILTGDLELYGKLVRKASWKCFGREFLETEKKYAHRDETEFSTMVDHLETQYLIKILKSEYRIPISTIKEYLVDKEFGINVKFKKDGLEHSIESCYDKLLEMIGGFQLGGNLLELQKQFLLGLSLRTQIRLLSKIKDLDLMRFELKKENMKIEDMERLAEGIQVVFWNDISQKANNAKSLIKPSPIYTIEMLKFLDFTKSISIGNAFIPQTEDYILNNALFAISSRYNHLIRNYKHLVFDYWCRITYTETFFEQIPEPLFSSFLDYSLLKTDSGLVKSMGMMQAFYASMSKKSSYSVIGIDKLPYFPYFYFDVSSEFYMLPSFGIKDSKGMESAYFSIYKLMALISDLMRLCNDCKDDYILDNISIHLSKHAQYRTFSTPNNNTILTNEELDKSQSEPEEIMFKGFLDNAEFVNREKKKEFAKQFINWEKTDNIEVSCQFLHHIFVRFYYTMAHVSSDISIADRFNKYVLSLLNAALVETTIDNGYSDFIMSNLGDIEDIFMYNVCWMKEQVKNDKGKKNSFNFFYWLASCPLLLIFIDPAVANYLKNGDLSKDEMDLWRKYHIRNKKRKYCEKRQIMLENENKNLKRKLDDVSNMTKFAILQNSVEQLNYFMQYETDKDTFISLKNDYDKKRKQMKKLQNKIPNELKYDNHIVSFDSEISKLDNMSIFLSNGFDFNRQQIMSNMESMNKLDESLKQLGLIEEYKKYEDEQYTNMDDGLLNVYYSLEKLYPLYRDNDK